MATVEIYLRGDQIATFQSLTVQGAANGTQVQLNGVQALAGPDTWFWVVVRNVAPGEELFSDGQLIDIYAWPPEGPDDEPLFADIVSNPDAYNGRASSGEHQIFTSPHRILFDVDGFEEGSIRYGPGEYPPREEQLAFDSFRPDPPIVIPCFTPGTLIETRRGAVPVETLRPGDMVRTADHGFQPLRWIGRRRVTGRGEFAPVVIEAGALGNARRLTVSPQHRMLLSDWRATLYFGEAEVFVAAKHLVNGTTIRRDERAQVTYVHIAFDRHEVVFAEGVPSESLFVGPGALSGLDAEARAEVTALFPELAVDGAPLATARTCLRAWEATLLAA